MISNVRGDRVTTVTLGVL